MHRTDLLPATGDCKGVSLIIRDAEQAAETADTAEVRPGVIYPTTTRPAVEMDAPAVMTNHGEILLLLFRVERLNGLRALIRCEAATGTALIET